MYKKTTRQNNETKSNRNEKVVGNTPLLVYTRNIFLKISYNNILHNSAL